MKKFLIFNFIFLLIIAGFLFLPLVSKAGLVPCGNSQDDPNTTDIDESKPCQLCHLFILFKNIVNFLLSDIVPPVAVLMIIIGGFMFIFAHFGAIGGEGGPGLILKARKLFLYTVIGIFLIYSSWLIVNLFFQIIRVQEFSGINLKEDWWKISCPIN